VIKVVMVNHYPDWRFTLFPMFEECSLQVRWMRMLAEREARWFMRAFKVLALALASASAVIAGTLILDPFGALPSAVDLRDPPEPLGQRAAPAPVIIVGPAIHVSSLTPLPIEIGPPQWVPRDSTLDIRGLPSGVALSRGRRLSDDLWAIPVGDLASLHIKAAASALGASDVTLTLVAADGSVLANASTRISISASTLAAADTPASSSPIKQRSEDAPPVSDVPAPTREPLRNAAPPLASEGSSPALAAAEEPVGRAAIALLGESAREAPTGDPPEPEPSAAPSAAERDGEVGVPSSAAATVVRTATVEALPAMGTAAKQEQPRARATSAEIVQENKPAVYVPAGESPEPLPSGAPPVAERIAEVEVLSGPAPADGRLPTFEATAIGASAKQEPSPSGATSTAAEGLGLAPVIAQESKSAIALSGAALITPAHANCMIAGGWGTGVFESFAGYMAETAMKNSVKAKLGDEARIGAVTKKCEQKGLLIECTARARGCR
jgi:hypothetical protein